MTMGGRGRDTPKLPASPIPVTDPWRTSRAPDWPHDLRHSPL